MQDLYTRLSGREELALPHIICSTKVQIGSFESCGSLYGLYFAKRSFSCECELNFFFMCVASFISLSKEAAMELNCDKDQTNIK